MLYLYLALIESGGIHFAEDLRGEIHRAFGLETRVMNTPMDITPAYNPIRSQYDGSTLLSLLLAHSPSDALAVLGVTALDLFTPIFEYLFGLAQLNGRGAVLSTYRLRNELYGLAPDADLLAERLAKEAFHELGHVFGLVHCFSPWCVMNPSAFVEQIDSKSREFCRACRARIEKLPAGAAGALQAAGKAG